MIKKEDLKIGTKFRGNVNNAIIEVVDIQKTTVILKDCKTGKNSWYGLEALLHCDITILN